MYISKAVFCELEQIIKSSKILDVNIDDPNIDSSIIKNSLFFQYVQGHYEINFEPVGVGCDNFNPEIILFAIKILVKLDIAEGNIRELDVSFCNLKDYSISVAKEIAKFTSLHKLSFALNNLQEKASLVLGELAKSKTLKSVDLSNNGLNKYIKDVLKVFSSSNFVSLDVTELAPLLNAKHIQDNGHNGLVKLAIENYKKNSDIFQQELKYVLYELLPDNITALIGEYSELAAEYPIILF